ncbi:hypothetical protein [Pseudomonas chlororaphis]|uniref:hypothetical protein n=1 Tax=Pseudomonas chlororaphis TaxID=587753 RepID=UPI000BE28E47|nr:hypothetical protein [Pseudomonas chlororaphis]
MQRIAVVLITALIVGCTSQVAHGNQETALAPAVQATIKHLKLPAAIKPLSYIEAVGTVREQQKSSAVREEYFLRVDPDSGQWLIRSQRDDLQRNELSFMGLVTLQGVTQTPLLKSVTVLNHLSFEGDWQQMPTGAQLAYTTLSTSKVSGFGAAEPSNRVEVTHCTVKRSLAAAQVNAGLSGEARELRCSLDDDPFAQVSTFYYLRDYAYFFNARSEFALLKSYELRLQTFN